MPVKTAGGNRQITYWIIPLKVRFLRPALALAFSAGLVALALVLDSCSTLDRTVVAPPMIEGATFVGDKACLDCHAKIRSSLPRQPTCAAATRGGKEARAAWMRIVPRTSEQACRDRRGRSRRSLSLIPEEPAGVLRMPPGHQRRIPSSPASPRHGRENELRAMPRSAWLGHHEAGRRPRHGPFKPILRPVPSGADSALCLRARRAPRRVHQLPQSTRLD